MGGRITYGAQVHDDGVSFRLWAPSADHVGLKGDFNSWSDNLVQMEMQSDGTWFVDVSGAKVGHEYKYVIIYKGHQFERNDPRARQLTASGDATVVVDPNFDWDDAGFAPSPREKLVLYELHVGTFARREGEMVGTFDDAADKLDYLLSLGVNAVEVMPCSAAWMDRWWGYTPTNIYAVEASYGGRAAFQRFVQAAHSKGLAVILDVVYNHFGKDAGLDLWQFDGWGEHDKGGIYFYNDDRGWTPWGDTRPDYSRPEVRRYITDNVRMWFEEYHVDGLRVDSTIHIRNIKGQNNDPDHDLSEGWLLLQEVNQQAHTSGASIMIAEDLQGNEAITRPAVDGGAGFDAQWDPSTAAILHEVLVPPNDADRQMQKIDFALGSILDGDALSRVVYSESHDTDANGHARLGEEISPGDANSLFARKRSALAITMVMTMPGTPMLFQGQEFQQGGAFSHWAALEWSKVEQNKGMVELYRHLIALRQNKYSNTAGLMGQHIDVFHSDADAKLVAFHRWDKAGKGDDVVVVLNFANEIRNDYQLSFPYSGTWQVRFNSDWRGYGQDFGNIGPERIEVTADSAAPGRYVSTVTIGAYAGLIISSDT